MTVSTEAKRAYASGSRGWVRYDDEFVQRSTEANGQCWFACECGIWLSVKLGQTIYCGHCEREYHFNPGGLYRRLRGTEDPPTDHSPDCHGLGRLWEYYQCIAPAEQAMELLKMHLDRQ